MCSQPVSRTGIEGTGGCVFLVGRRTEPRKPQTSPSLPPSLPGSLVECQHLKASPSPPMSHVILSSFFLSQTPPDFPSSQSLILPYFWEGAPGHPCSCGFTSPAIGFWGERREKPLVAVWCSPSGLIARDFLHWDQREGGIGNFSSVKESSR